MSCEHEDGVKITAEMPCPFCRIKKLECENESLANDAKIVMAASREEIERLKEQLATAQKWDEADHCEYSKLKEAYALRGERMEQMWKHIRQGTTYQAVLCCVDWFDGDKVK